jgi:hypothetical protein
MEPDGSIPIPQTWRSRRAFMHGGAAWAVAEAPRRGAAVLATAPALAVGAVFGQAVWRSG